MEPQDTDQQGTFSLRDMERVGNYTTFFGEWTQRDGDLLVHLFPRAGEDDQWTDGHYLPVCRNCKYDRSGENFSRGKLTPCPRCNRTGLIYEPGNREVKSEASFPDDMKDIIMKSLDENWDGDVAIVFTEELGAYAVQMQGAALRGDPHLLEHMFDNLDWFLESRNVE